MDALELLKTRKSLSAAFLGPPGPTKDQLTEILSIAARVPDHGKLSPWRFIVFEGDARHAAGEAIAAGWAKAHPEADEKKLADERKRLANAPVVVGVVSRAAPHEKIPEWEQVLSAGNAAMTLLLAAQALGFHANWTTGWIATDPDIGRVLGLKPGERFIAFVHIGTATVPITDRPRPQLTDVVTYWTG